MLFVELMLLAFVLEIALGWPDKLFSVIKHPVVWVGSLITFLERRLNQPSSTHSQHYLKGVVTSVLVIGVSVVVALCISVVLPNNFMGWIIEAVVASSLLASRSLYTHVNATAIPLQAGNLSSARIALSHIVGRDTNALDESSIASAAIESLAENASDGIYAPLFWGLLLGLPGIAGYKAINTLDSMIGHRSERYLSFGRFAAKLDDVVNLIPARISALLIAIVGGSLAAFSNIVSDAAKHRSPNAGWPEGAMAQALQIRLSGPRVYNDKISDEPWLNPTGSYAQALDVERALRIYKKSLALTGVLLLLSVAFSAFL